MSAKPTYAQQSREEIARAGTNHSTAKQLWTFSKKKRFQPIKTQCPVSFYQKELSTISKITSGFPISKRKVFTECNEVPLPGTYEQNTSKSRKSGLFAQSRDKCQFKAYISRQIASNPGPNCYMERKSSKSKGYSFRPKTAHNRNYFIDDKELKEVPSPFKYDINLEHNGKAFSSKFRSTTLGQIGLKNTQHRFPESPNKNPGPSLYHPRTVSLKSQHLGGSIGNLTRQSFIDEAKKLSFQPGPGNYEAPTQFAHYKPSNLSLSNRRD